MLAVGGGYVAVGLVKDVQFAHARDDVASARAELLNVNDFAGAYKTVGKSMEPSVVNIQVVKTVKAAGNIVIPKGNGNDLLKKFFDRDGDGTPDIQIPDGDELQGDQQQIGTGSGVIIETDGDTGYIVTNNHVAGGAEEMLVVTLADGREIKKAKLVGNGPEERSGRRENRSAERLIAAQMGQQSDDLQQRVTWIMAFGSPVWVRRFDDPRHRQRA